MLGRSRQFFAASINEMEAEGSDSWWKQLVGQLSSQCEASQRDLTDARCEVATLRHQVAELTAIVLKQQQEVGTRQETFSEAAAAWESDDAMLFIEAVRETKHGRVRYPTKLSQMKLSGGAACFSARTPNALAIAKGILKDQFHGRRPPATSDV